jgi:hypothetical protein
LSIYLADRLGWPPVVIATSTNRLNIQKITVITMVITLSRLSAVNTQKSLDFRQKSQLYSFANRVYGSNLANFFSVGIYARPTNFGARVPVANFTFAKNTYPTHFSTIFLKKTLGCDNLTEGGMPLVNQL